MCLHVSWFSNVSWLGYTICVQTSEQQKQIHVASNSSEATGTSTKKPASLGLPVSIGIALSGPSGLLSSLFLKSLFKRLVIEDKLQLSSVIFG
jgi:hypothetical protein